MNEITKARMKAGLSQLKASQLLGVTEKTYIDWEKNRRNLKPYKVAGILSVLKKAGCND